MWKHIVRPGRQQMTVWRMRIACWIPKATNTQYVILIAFPLQQWLQELCVIVTLYVHCLVILRLFINTYVTHSRHN